MRIEKVDGVLPQTYTPDTLYFVKNAASGLMGIYVSDSLGQTVRHVITREEIVSNYITISDTAPALPHETQLWWSSVTGTLYIQYFDGNNILWVEAINSITVPEFAGNGTANTMSRSDHYHTTITLSAAEW